MLITCKDGKFDIDLILIENKSKLIHDLLSRKIEVVLPYDSCVIYHLNEVLLGKYHFALCEHKATGYVSETLNWDNCPFELKVKVISLTNFLLINDLRDKMLSSLRTKFLMDRNDPIILLELGNELLHEFCLKLGDYKIALSILTQLDEHLDSEDKLVELMKDCWDEEFALKFMSILDCTNFYSESELLLKLRVVNPSAYEELKLKKSFSDGYWRKYNREFSNLINFKVLKKLDFTVIDFIFEDKWMIDFYLSAECSHRVIEDRNKKGIILISLLRNSKNKEVSDFLVRKILELDASLLLSETINDLIEDRCDFWRRT